MRSIPSLALVVGYSCNLVALGFNGASIPRNKRRLFPNHLVLSAESGPQVRTTTEGADPDSFKVELDEEQFGAPILAIDPALIEIVRRCDSLDLKEDEPACLLGDTLSAQTRYPFVQMLRSSSPYIGNHRGELAVLHIPGDLLAWDGFDNLIDDIALCWLLGMKIVIVAGCRHQVNGRSKNTLQEQIRVTDPETLRIVEEEAGFVRFELERQLNRCLRLQEAGGNVMSGNFFTARPFGVVDGVDYQYSGGPEKLNIDKVVDILQNKDIVLLTPIGIGPTGEGVNVHSESLAAFVAASLRANKVIFCSNDGMVLRDKETGKLVQNFRVRDSHAIVGHNKLHVHDNYFLSLGNGADRDMKPEALSMLLKIGWSTRALKDGVERAHIIAPTNGALIEELFTAKDGSGTCISQDTFQSIHPDDDSGDREMSNRDFQAQFFRSFD